MEVKMMSNTQDAPKKDLKMSDGLVALGSIAIVGLVAVLIIALVYNRAIWVQGSRDALEVRTSRTVHIEPDAAPDTDPPNQD
jgi:hypothetical protein